MFGHIAIGNKRKGGTAFPKDYIIIDVDRKNKILGNKYVLKNYLDDEERAQVINSYKIDYEIDWEENGPMKQESLKIARLVYKGKNVVLNCWCAGPPTFKPCHAEIIKDKIEEFLEDYR